MSSIIEIKELVIKFIKENTPSQDVTVIRLEKKAADWHAVVESYEDDAFLKAMGYPPKKNRVFYTVVVGGGQEIVSFNRKNELDKNEDSDE